MSITINSSVCVGCGKCIKACPGVLLYLDQDNKAHSKYPRDCWGCAACVKECGVGAIKYYLGADIGGKGTYLYTKTTNKKIDFHFVGEKEKKVISINRLESNKY